MGKQGGGISNFAALSLGEWINIWQYTQRAEEKEEKKNLLQTNQK